jgi:Heterokaryon incompatibility protein (HET)
MCWDDGKHEANADDLPPPHPRARDLSGATASPQHPLGLQVHSSTSGSALIAFQSCRYCSDLFTYVREDGQRIHIIAGPPKPLQPKVNTSSMVKPPEAFEYKAISYVWGETSKLPMYCVQCKANFGIELQDVRKFQSIANLAFPDESIWLDTMSINQDDPADKERQIAHMGQLYGDAATVGVLLPACDERGFQLLASLSAKASFINANQMAFSENADPYPDNQLTKACNDFYTLVEEFEQSLHSLKYWSRAWTFQEWAMASTIDVGLEGSPTIIRNIKDSVLQAATLMSIYKLQQHAYAKISLGFPRGEVTRRLNTVKRLFPDERAFLSADEAVEDKTEYLNQTLLPSFGVDKLLGLRTSSSLSQPYEMIEGKPKPLHELFDLRGPRPEFPIGFKSRLSTMLNAFAISQREARFEADKVTCWASMCNISFEYSAKDSYSVTLDKVLTAIRETPGFDIRLFSWQANRNLQAGVDSYFLPYASLHLQSNARNAAEFYGTPILTGRADTLRHMEVSLRQSAQTQPSRKSTLVQALIAGKLKLQAAQMNFIDQALKLLRPAISGASDGIMVQDIVPMARSVLERTPSEVLASKALVVVTIETTAIDSGEPRMCALWTIIPYDRSYSELMVARECVNGQLVLIARRQDRCDIIGYLTFTDQLCGTYLAWCNTEGKWLTRLDFPQRSDVVVAELVKNEIWWAGKYELSNEVKSL